MGVLERRSLMIPAASESSQNSRTGNEKALELHRGFLEPRGREANCCEGWCGWKNRVLGAGCSTKTALWPLLVRAPHAELGTQDQNDAENHQDKHPTLRCLSAKRRMAED